MSLLRTLFHKHDPNQPCPHMEKLLQNQAEGRLRGIARWYALAHAANCGPCRRFLEHLESMLAKLKASKEPVEDEVLDRLMQGDWRNKT